MKKLTLIVLSVCNVFILQAQDGGKEILGTWMVDTEDAQVEIFQEAGEYKGKVVWLKEPNTPKGEPKTDKKNPDKSLKGRPIIGMPIVSGLSYEEGNWEGGQIYSAKKGRTVNCSMRMEGTDKLVITVSVSSFSTSKTWTRVK